MTPRHPLSVQAEIDGRRDAFEALRQFAERLLQEKHTASDVIADNLVTLQAVQDKVRGGGGSH